MKLGLFKYGKQLEGYQFFNCINLIQLETVATQFSEYWKCSKNDMSQIMVEMGNFQF